MSLAPARWNIDLPLWDQSTYMGRFKHFGWVTDPRLVFYSTSTLMNARELVLAYKSGKESSGTSRNQLIQAKRFYESSFHPDSGELMNVFGRMSCQVPGGIALIGAMLIWYRSVSAVIFWQWANQSFNALVNYTNRNAKSPTSPKQLLVAYTMATSAALGSALGCKAYFAKSSSVLLQRMVPFIAVAAANCVNLPLMRQSEFVNGVTVNDELGNPVAKSKYAPAKGIFQVVVSRIAIAAPAMMLVPVVMERLEKEAWFVARRAMLNNPAQMLLTAIILLPSVPGGCALFPQRCSIKLERLKWFDRPEYDRVIAEYGAKGLQPPQRLYFNKGL